MHRPGLASRAQSVSMGPRAALNPGALRAQSVSTGPRAAPFPGALRALLGSLASAALVVAAPGCVAEVTPAAQAAQAAPAPLPEIVSSPPAPGMVWVAGCWHRDGADYVWLPGHWDSAPPAATAAAADGATDATDSADP